MLGGVWLALIGWFLAGAATAEGRHAEPLAGFEGVSVRDVMTPDPFVAPGWWTIDAFADHVATAGVRHRVFPVVSFDGAPSGLVSLAELADATVRPGRVSRRRAGQDHATRRARRRGQPTDNTRTVELAHLGHRPVQPTDTQR